MFVVLWCAVVLQRGFVFVFNLFWFVVLTLCFAVLYGFMLIINTFYDYTEKYYIYRRRWLGWKSVGFEIQRSKRSEVRTPSASGAQDKFVSFSESSKMLC